MSAWFFLMTHKAGELASEPTPWWLTLLLVAGAPAACALNTYLQRRQDEQ